MIVISKFIRKGLWSGDHVDCIYLSWQERCRRRISMKTNKGFEFLLNLDKPSMLRDGDALVNPDNNYIKIIAKKEELMRVSCNSNHQLAILSWHIGNRHLNAEIKDNSIFLYRDTVISEMLKGLNAKVENVLEKFHPLEGAYSHSKHNH